MDRRASHSRASRPHKTLCVHGWPRDREPADTIGNTPIVRLNRIAPEGIEMFVKVESFNPLASVKDRLAFAIVNDAEQRGLLKPGDTVVEATSGNTGIALAMVCAARGYGFVATMADSFSVERRQIIFCPE